MKFFQFNKSILSIQSHKTFRNFYNWLIKEHDILKIVINNEDKILYLCFAAFKEN